MCHVVVEGCIVMTACNGIHVDKEEELTTGGYACGVSRFSSEVGVWSLVASSTVPQDVYRGARVNA